jgi:hypothetical protein
VDACRVAGASIIRTANQPLLRLLSHQYHHCSDIGLVGLRLGAFLQNDCLQQEIFWDLLRGQLEGMPALKTLDLSHNQWQALEKSDLASDLPMSRNGCFYDLVLLLNRIESVKLSENDVSLVEILQQRTPFMLADAMGEELKYTSGTLAVNMNQQGDDLMDENTFDVKMHKLKQEIAKIRQSSDRHEWAEMLRFNNMNASGERVALSVSQVVELLAVVRECTMQHQADKAGTVTQIIFDLDLRSAQLGDEHMALISQAVRSGMHISGLRIDDNPFTHVAVSEVARSMQSASELTFLSVGQTACLSEEAYSDFLIGIEDCDLMDCISICGSELSEGFMGQFMTSVVKNGHVRELDLQHSQLQGQPEIGLGDWCRMQLSNRDPLELGARIQRIHATRLGSEGETTLETVDFDSLYNNSAVRRFVLWLLSDPDRCVSLAKVQNIMRGGDVFWQNFQQSLLVLQRLDSGPGSTKVHRERRDFYRKHFLVSQVDTFNDSLIASLRRLNSGDGDAEHQLQCVLNPNFPAGLLVSPEIRSLRVMSDLIKHAVAVLNKANTKSFFQLDYFSGEGASALASEGVNYFLASFDFYRKKLGHLVGDLALLLIAGACTGQVRSHSQVPLQAQGELLFPQSAWRPCSEKQVKYMSAIDYKRLLSLQRPGMTKRSKVALVILVGVLSIAAVFAMMYAVAPTACVALGIMVGFSQLAQAGALTALVVGVASIGAILYRQQSRRASSCAASGLMVVNDSSKVAIKSRGTSTARAFVKAESAASDPEFSPKKPLMGAMRSTLFYDQTEHGVAELQRQHQGSVVTHDPLG